MKTQPSHRRRFNAETQRRRGAEPSHHRRNGTQRPAPAVSPPSVTLSEGVRRPSRRVPTGSDTRYCFQRHSELRGILRLASLAQNDRFPGVAVVTRRSVSDGCDETLNYQLSTINSQLLRTAFVSSSLCGCDGCDETLNCQLLTVNSRWCDVSAPLRLCASALSLRWRDGCDETGAKR